MQRVHSLGQPRSMLKAFAGAKGGHGVPIARGLPGFVNPDMGELSEN